MIEWPEEEKILAVKPWYHVPMVDSPRGGTERLFSVRTQTACLMIGHQAREVVGRISSWFIL